MIAAAKSNSAWERKLVIKVQISRERERERYIF